MARKRIGYRNHVAIFERHNGTKDFHGNPTLDVKGDWGQVGHAWPCERLQTRGGETIRGRQVAAETTDVLYGYALPTGSVLPTDRVNIDGEILQIVWVADTDGRRMETVVEAKTEVR